MKKEFIVEHVEMIPDGFDEVEYGEWSHTMSNIPKMTGDVFQKDSLYYVISDGVYYLYEYFGGVR